MKLRYDMTNWTRARPLSPRIHLFHLKSLAFSRNQACYARAFRARWHVKCTGLYFSLSLSFFHVIFRAADSAK